MVKSMNDSVKYQLISLLHGEVTQRRRYYILVEKYLEFMVELSFVIDEETTKHTYDKEHNSEYTHVEPYLNMEVGYHAFLTI